MPDRAALASILVASALIGVAFAGHWWGSPDRGDWWRSVPPVRFVVEELFVYSDTGCYIDTVDSNL